MAFFWSETVKPKIAKSFHITEEFMLETVSLFFNQWMRKIDGKKQSNFLKNDLLSITADAYDVINVSI